MSVVRHTGQVTAKDNSAPTSAPGMFNPWTVQTVEETKGEMSLPA